MKPVFDSGGDTPVLIQMFSGGILEEDHTEVIRACFMIPVETICKYGKIRYAEDAIGINALYLDSCCESYSFGLFQAPVAFPRYEGMQYTTLPRAKEAFPFGSRPGFDYFFEEGADIEDILREENPSTKKDKLLEMLEGWLVDLDDEKFRPRCELLDEMPEKLAEYSLREKYPIDFAYISEGLEEFTEGFEKE